MNKQGEHGQREYRCGDLNMHWYDSGDACICGQIPATIFFAVNCTCGASKTKSHKPSHAPNCAYVAWAKQRNKWIAENETDPRLDNVRVCTSEYYQDWNGG